MTTSSSSAPSNRRHFLVRAIVAVQGAIGAALGAVIGRATLGPSFAGARSSWLKAAPMTDIVEGQPTPVTLRIIRQDGYRQVVDRRVVYVSRDSAGGVRVLDSTCTHLGCRTRFDSATKQFVCPCHGGVYDMDGQVVAGPPPGPLRALEARVDDGHVVVRV